MTMSATVVLLKATALTTLVLQEWIEDPGEIQIRLRSGFILASVSIAGNRPFFREKAL